MCIYYTVNYLFWSCNACIRLSLPSFVFLSLYSFFFGLSPSSLSPILLLLLESSFSLPPVPVNVPPSLSLTLSIFHFHAYSSSSIYSSYLSCPFTPQTFFSKAVSNDTFFLSIISVVDYSILVGFDEDSHEIVVGIIDYMRQVRMWNCHGVEGLIVQFY